ncbi:pentapeptide repeat-containing protein [Corynebacterium nasicanis]|uniref:Pentapeptide repeat-containing protein n=1 Tax=Corynebacterium nasicanis TaxID=1448267 RepID=A0ABW1QDV5_9CORY
MKDITMSQRLDERFFQSSRSLRSRSSLLRLVAVYDLLHLADSWSITDLNSATGRLQEIINLLITFIDSGDVLARHKDPTVRAREAALSGLCSRFAGPPSEERGQVVTIFDMPQFVPNYQWKAASLEPENPTVEVRVDFSDINLSHLRVSGVTLSRLLFQGANLSYTEFDDATANEANFSGANLESTTFNGNFWRSSFEQSRATGLIVRGNMTKSSFIGCELAFASFTGSNLEGCIFDGANLDQADFTGATCNLDTFDGARVSGSTIFPDGSSIDKEGRDQVMKRWPGVQVL